LLCVLYASKIPMCKYRLKLMYNENLPKEESIIEERCLQNAWVEEYTDKHAFVSWGKISKLFI